MNQRLVIVVVLFAVSIVGTILGAKFVSTVDDYFKLRNWDSLTVSGFSKKLDGDTITASRRFKLASNIAAELSTPSPFLEISKNQLGDILLRKANTRAARVQFSSAADSLRQYLKQQSPTSRYGLVAVHELVFALVRLADIYKREGETSTAVNLLDESLGCLATLSSAGEDELLPMREEQMRAFVGRLELAGSNDKKSKRLFEQARDIDSNYSVNSRTQDRFDQVAASFRERDGIDELASLTAPPNILSARTSDETLLEAIKSPWRTTRDDCLLVAATLKACERYRGLNQTGKSNRLLNSISQSSLPESTLTTSLWQELARELDRINDTNAAVIMLDRCRTSLEKRRRYNPVVRAELLYELGRRELLLNRTRVAKQHLQESYTIYINRLYRLRKRRIAPGLAIRPVGRALAESMEKNGEIEQAITILDQACNLNLKEIRKDNLSDSLFKLRLLTRSGKWDSALVLANQVYLAARQVGDNTSTVEAALLLGPLYLEKQLPDQAEQTLLTAIALCKKGTSLKDREMESRLMFPLARVLVVRKKIQEARDLLLENQDRLLKLPLAKAVKHELLKLNCDRLSTVLVKLKDSSGIEALKQFREEQRL